ncbi:di-trans,poly-cis-decaprenylcistransferase [Candidatus Saccharibacteria bacterium]|nr:MAG: di-trans,poly-cis-decaprenylcistransferase [Candidatus Saccharibacteria bacterium]
MNTDQSDPLLPRHVGYILDGNRRWARSHGLPDYDGHMAGYTALADVLEETFRAGVEYVSIYAFSTENWKRDSREVNSLMKLSLHAFSHDLKRMISSKVRVQFLGLREGLNQKILDVMDRAEEKSRSFTDHKLAVCFNYGGQQEIVDAVRACYDDGLDRDAITTQAIAERLYAPDVPPVDLVVRTSGEQRLSNFMTWRTAYSELLFMDKYWPDMTPEDVHAILAEYASRQRRYGA